MPDFTRFDLPSLWARDIEFIEAAVPADHPSPLAIIYYNVGGERASAGLRLDMDKRRFLDQPEETATDPNIDDAGHRVTRAVNEILLVNV